MKLIEQLAEIFGDYIVKDKKENDSYVVKGKIPRHFGSLMWDWDQGNCVYLAKDLVYENDGTLVRYIDYQKSFNIMESSKQLCKLLKIDFSTVSQKVKKYMVENKLKEVEKDFK